MTDDDLPKEEAECRAREGVRRMLTTPKKPAPVSQKHEGKSKNGRPQPDPSPVKPDRHNR